MSSLVLAVLIGWLIALVIFLGFIALLRYIDHRERMALIARGMDPNRLRRHRMIEFYRLVALAARIG